VITPVPPLDTITLSPELVFNKLKELNPSKSPGPEGWPIAVLREVADKICTPLYIIFTKSLESSLLPDDWKVGFVTPIFKKGNRHLPNNYRPISLTSSIAKILESIVKDNIICHMFNNNLIDSNQHGFTSHKSCITQLLTAMEYWTQSLDSGASTDVIYLDISKAFDSVPHVRLLSKLKAYSIGGHLLKWISNYLIGRKQCVVLNGCRSNWALVKSGVPQGTVLGPILFTIYVNDLPSAVNSHCLMFADDTKLFRSIYTDEDVLQLQRDLHALCEWSSKWQLLFNYSKCTLLTIGRSSHTNKYLMDSFYLENVESAKDLGITIDKHLKFHQHCSQTISKANRMLGIIAKSFEFLNEEMFLKIYITMVRPILEYGNLIWGPHFKLDQIAIEKVQRRATRLLKPLLNLTYQERLSHLKLPSLQYRRLRGDMIYMYQIFHQLASINSSLLFSSPHLSSTRGHNYKVYKPYAKCKARTDFFAVRTIDEWNNLPSVIVNSTSLSIFKNKLDDYWQHLCYIHSS